MDEEMISEPTAEPVAAPVETTEAPTPDQTMERVHDEMRPEPQPRVKGQFASRNTTTPRPNGVPQSWAADKHPIWERIPPEGRDYIAQRELEAQQRISQLGTTAKIAEGVNGVYEQYKQ